MPAVARSTDAASGLRLSGVEQAAIETGVSPNVLQRRLYGKASGRLSMMIRGREPMPRDSWDSIGFDGVPGGFEQAMVLV